MFKNNCPRTISLCVILLLAGLGSVFAVEDGFLATKKISGKYFTVFYESGVDISVLPEQLNISPSDRILVGKTAVARPFSDEEIAEMLDILFLRVCDILDMRLYSFAGNIKICRDNARLAKVYFELFKRELNNMQSFYVYELNTIYVSAQNFKRGVVGHEIAHAIISHYFVVQPSVKIQEVLAGYVEYQLRKPSQR